MPERPPPRMARSTRAVYRPNHSQSDGMGGFLRSDQVRDVTAEIAEQIRAGAAAGSARGDDSPHMADQWKVKKKAGLRKVGGNLRVRVDVYNPDIAAAAQEFGNKGGDGPRKGWDRDHVLRRVASVFGDFRDHGEKDT